MKGRLSGDLSRALLLCALLASPFALFAQDPTPQPTPTSRPTSQPTGGAQQAQLPPLGAPAGAFGAPVRLADPVPLERVVADPASFHGRSVVVAGRIADVCRKKGCWMVITDGERQVRVRFKDYGFFVPRDASGRRVLLEGAVKAEEISEEVARHYAEEGGNPERAAEIHGPQQVVSIIATGVEVLAREDLPLVAQGGPEQAKPLIARLTQGERLAPGAGAAATLEAALAALRAAPGGRVAEVGLAAELVEWFVFGASGAGADPFARGWAVRRSSGEVLRFPAAGAGSR
jgi:hypothetical protein